MLREQTVTVHLKLAPFVCACAVCTSVTLRRGNVSVAPEGGLNCCSIHILVLWGGAVFMPVKHMSVTVDIVNDQFLLRSSKNCSACRSKWEGSNMVEAIHAVHWGSVGKTRHICYCKDLCAIDCSELYIAHSLIF